MSKKCCGIIYNEDEKFCTMCGKKLVDIEEPEQSPQAEEPEVSDKEDIQISEEEAQKKLDAMNLPIMNLEEIDKLTADIMGNTKKEEEPDQPRVSQEETSEANEALEQGESDGKAPEAGEDNIHEQEGAVDEASKEPSDKKNAKAIFDEDDDDEDDDEDENKASVGLKIMGFLSLLIMFAAIGVVVLGLIFVMFDPFYKKYDSGQIVTYPELGTNTDAMDQTIHQVLPDVVLDKEEEATATSAMGNVSEATPSDATDTDAEDTEDTEDTETSEE